ncbi:hypothetical protein ACFC3F_11565 [Microbacterium sp. NPDC055910]|uniref:hypothetical protein n=1 Tax=Microbacterium sp. NPDC055910 TaxID=3345659 RepID=UPI0035D86131
MPLTVVFAVRSADAIDTIDLAPGPSAPDVTIASGNAYADAVVPPCEEHLMFKQDFFHPTDLVLFVWPSRIHAEPSQSEAVWREDAAGTAWAMERAKADRVRVLVSVAVDTIVGAWHVTGSESTLTAREGKTRRVNRSRFDMRDDARLHYLVGKRSQVPRRRNPQTTIELRDLFGGESLLEPRPDARRHGVVRIGDYTLTVGEDGTADLVYPARAVVTLRPEN